MIADINLTCKYAIWDSVMKRASDSLKTLLESSPRFRPLQKKLIDVKIQNLKVGDYTCNPGWHRDSISDPEAYHHLYVLGYNRTEFKDAFGLVFKIPEAYWYSYTDQLHRGPKCEISETRLLVRITETSVIKGNSKVIML